MYPKLGKLFDWGKKLKQKTKRKVKVKMIKKLSA